MKIVLINTLYAPLSVGGAERVVDSLARSLVRGGDAVTVLTLTPDRTASVAHEAGVKIIRLPLRNVYWPFRTQHAAPARLLWHAIDSHNPVASADVASRLREEQPDLVHTHNLAGFSSSTFKAVKRLGLPLVHTLHDYYLLCPRSTMYRRQQNCAKRCGSCALFSAPRRASAKSIDAVVGVSEFVLGRHEAQDLFASTVTRQVIHNCMTHDVPRELQPPGPDRGNSAPLRVGYLGRVEPVKGLEVLLGATDLLVPGSWVLHVAGEGDPGYVDELRARFPSPSITYAGRSSLSDFFRHVDVLVVPSLWNEPLGMVAFEAYFFGVPVIASTSGGLPEIVTPDTGVLVEPGSTQALASALQNLQSNPAHLARLSSGAARAARQFEPARMGDAYRSVYAKAVRAAVRTEGFRV